jgi:hypothetical protein
MWKYEAHTLHAFQQPLREYPWMSWHEQPIWQDLNINSSANMFGISLCEWELPSQAADIFTGGRRQAHRHRHIHQAGSRFASTAHLNNWSRVPTIPKRVSCCAVSTGVSFCGRRGWAHGLLVTLAIGIHNIPEGLAVATVLVARGTTPRKALEWTLLCALPQPLFAVPSFIFVESFKMLLPVSMGFAAGCMLWIVVAELLPDALEDMPAGACTSLRSENLSSLKTAPCLGCIGGMCSELLR